MYLSNKVFELTKSIIERTPFSPAAKRVYYYYRRKVGLRHPIQDTSTKTEYPLVRLGTEYGGWTFIDDPDLNNSTIISAGLGLDASFDMKFADKYNADVIIIDPTPRAIQHFNNIINTIDQDREKPFTEGGDQPVEAYNTSGIDEAQLTLIKKALWDKETKIEFYKPEMESHVSHSIINWQHNYTDDTDYIEVQTDTIFSILESKKINKRQIKLVKFDIEGAEIEVISDMMEGDFCPNQILVEFDELHNPSKKAIKRVDRIHKLLAENGYVVIYTDGIADFLYFKEQ
jgi:FkbM family methyltransferase